MMRVAAAPDGRSMGKGFPAGRRRQTGMLMSTPSSTSASGSQNGAVARIHSRMRRSRRTGSDLRQSVGQGLVQGGLQRLPWPPGVPGKADAAAAAGGLLDGEDLGHVADLVAEADLGRA